MFSEVLTSHAMKGSSDTESQSRAGTRRGRCIGTARRSLSEADPLLT
jgi:hypothetical protein